MRLAPSSLPAPGYDPNGPDAPGAPEERPQGEATWLQRTAAWVAESRSHRVICVVCGIWMLNAFDLTFTILSHQMGMLHEENPVARLVLQKGTLPVTFFKIGMVLIGSYPLLRFRHARVTELGSYVILVAYGYLAIHWSMCYEFYSISATASINSMIGNAAQ